MAFITFGEDKDIWGVKRSGSSVVVENEGKGVCL